MPNTLYRRGKVYAADMAVYTRQMAADNSQEVSRLKRNLIRALKEDVTAKQRQVLLRFVIGVPGMREHRDNGLRILRKPPRAPHGDKLVPF